MRLPENMRLRIRERSGGEMGASLGRRKRLDDYSCAFLKSQRHLPGAFFAQPEELELAMLLNIGVGTKAASVITDFGFHAEQLTLMQIPKGM
jgi:hypothetical protein